jgi:putative membrane protein
MNRKCRNFAVVGAAVVLLPAMLAAQTDLNGNAGAYPQAGSGMSQPNGTNQQSGQPGMPGAAGTQRSQMGSMRDSLGAPGETGQQMMDQQFVRAAAESGIAAVELGKLATVKGSDAVKDLAQKLVDDHAAMNKDMDAVADSMGVLLPKKMSKDAQKEYDALNGLSGKDFDTEYVTYTAKAHFAEFHSFHMEAAVAANADLTAEVVKELGTMHQHVGLIVNVAKEEDIVLPPRPQRPAGATTASK